jgi:hypothetical protein
MHTAQRLQSLVYFSQDELLVGVSTTAHSVMAVGSRIFFLSGGARRECRQLLMAQWLESLENTFRTSSWWMRRQLLIAQGLLTYWDLLGECALGGCVDDCVRR